MKDKHFLIVAIVLLFAYGISWSFTLPTGHAFDNDCWRVWTILIFEEGIGNIYSHNANYPPLYLHFLNVLGYISGSEPNINENIPYLRNITWFFEMFSLLLLLFLMKELRISPYWCLLILLNPAFWYNSQVWGQVDGIHTAFIFGAFIFSIAGNLVLAMVFLVLSVNMKLQAIIFLPPLIFILIPLLRKYKKQIIPAIFAAVAMQAILLLPFYENPGLVWETVTGSVDYFPVVSMNAFNMWYIFLQEDPMHVKDSGTFIGITYKAWGLITFFMTSVIFLLPLLIRMVSAAIHKEHLAKRDILGLLMLSTGLVAVGFFYFNTQMHERYMHPAILFLGAYSIISGRWIAYFFISAGYILNLEKVLMALELNNYETLIFTEEFIAVIIGIGILAGVFDLYRHYFSGRSISTVLRYFTSSRTDLSPSNR